MSKVTDVRVHYFRSEKNNGKGRRWGLDRAKGKYVTFLDHDDYYTDHDFFRKAVAIHEEHEQDDRPIAFVCANAQWHNEITDERGTLQEWPSGRADGINDYILNHSKYVKPLSTFPTVFRGDILRRAVPEGRSTADSLLYLQTAVFGDAWYMPDVVGVYRIHGANESSGVRNNPDYDARYLTTQRIYLRTRREVRDELYTKADRRMVDRWYIQTISGVIGFSAIAHPKIMDRLNLYRCVFSVSGFMPKLWVLLPLYRLKSKVLDVLRKITPLRELYRFIKRKFSHKDI